ncbi:hypothetical protein KIPB_004456 [Kipferlia bialata]|uniref:PH domain-containing protein n=1 Tax=Kipferlia bialata TaxID=797122 RepID=A0A391NL90_9EUKA|nr:hypothetical protein KIPB_004456 [Kipferlia bialata]|eukprot:g4456.t1
MEPDDLLRSLYPAAENLPKDILLQGPLRKVGSFPKRWQPRFFILTRKELRWHLPTEETVVEGRPRNAVPISSIRAVTPVRNFKTLFGGSASNSFSMVVFNEGRKKEYYMAADTVAEMNQWVSTLNERIQEVRG